MPESASQPESDLASAPPRDPDADADAPAPFFFEVEGLHKHFEDQHVLRGVTLNVPRSECLVVIGASGGGKSVFLKHLIGLLKPDAGSIHVDGTNIARMKERSLGPIRRKVGVLFQDGALFDSMNVFHNVAFPLREQGLRNRAEIEERVRDALRIVELEEHLEKMPIQLSGGMRKRVGLARAIISEPHCILYDEPTSGLDPIVSDSINYLIRRLQQEYQVTSVVVTHDMKSAYHVGDRIAFLRHGRIYFEGSPEELRASPDPAVQDFIEGRSHLSSPAATRVKSGAAESPES